MRTMPPPKKKKKNQTNMKTYGYNEHNYSHNTHLFNYDIVIEQ